MTRKNILKIAFITSIATFTILTHHNTLKSKQVKKPIEFKYKTDKEIYKEWHDIYIKAIREKEAKELVEKQKKENQNNLSRGGNIEEKTFILTFYTSLDCENGYGAITCEGKKLRDGVVANNVLPLHTKLYLEGYGKVEILDRGGSNFNTETRLDVFVARKKGESDYEYKKRVNSMGKVKVKGYIVK